MITKIENGWLVDIQPGGRHGRRVRKSFRTKDLAIAFERNQMYQAERISAGLGADITIVDLINRFDREYAQIHFRGYQFEKYRIGSFRRYFEAHNKKLSQFSFSDASEFLTTRKLQGMSVGTIAREINTLKRITSWAIEQDLLPFDPLQKLKRLKGAKRSRWLNESECEQALVACKQMCPEIYEAIFVALMTGFRLGNILELRAEDFEEKIVWARKTKSGKPYAVPIDPRLQPLVAEFKTRPAGPLFHIADLDRKFRKVMIAIGFYQGRKHPNSVVFHTLRHSFGAYWLNREVPIYTVSQWLGHSSVTMTESVYAHLSLQHHVELMQNSSAGRQSVDTNIIPFPQNPTVSSGPPRTRTENLVLKRDE